jgi:hypothetical protein
MLRHGIQQLQGISDIQNVDIDVVLVRVGLDRVLRHGTGVACRIAPNAVVVIVDG